MSYTFPAQVAWNVNGNAPVKNVSFQVYAVSDTTFTTPLAITDTFGNPLPGNILSSGITGVFPQFMQASNGTVVITSPSHTYAWTINAIPSDASTAAYINTPGSASASAVDTAVAGDVNNPASATAAALNAAYAPNVVKYVPAPTGVAATDTTNIQNAINALTATGGTVVLQAGLYNLTSAGLTGTGAGVTITGMGGTGQGVGLTWGATRLVAASAAGWAITWGTTGAGNASYGGPTLRDMQIVGNSTATGGVWLKGQSNFRLHNVTITGYTAGTGLNLDAAGSNSQYGEAIGLQVTNCKIGIQNNGSNGFRMIGGMLDANSNNGSVATGTTGIQVISGDTMRVIGTVIQFYETHVDLAVGLNAELHSCRFEGFTTAVKNAAPSTRIYGGSFNNSIVGLSGTAVNNLAAATNLMLDPGDVTQVSTVLTDAGTGTQTPIRRLATSSYSPGTAVVYSTSSTTSSDVDATNAAVTFTAPPTGRVLVRASATANLASGGGYYLSLREGAADLPNTKYRAGLWGASGAQVETSKEWEVTGLTPGSSHTYKLGFASISGTPQLQAGGDWGAMTLTVTG